MRVGVMGAGAIGGMVGALLSQSYEVVLVGRQEVVDAISERGVRVSGRTELHARPEASADPADLAGCDVVLLTVKSYDTVKASRQVAESEPRAMLVSLQNGLDNDLKVREGAPGLATSAAVTSMGVTYLGPGHLRHAGEGSTVLGRMACSPAVAKRTAELLSAGGLPVEHVENIRGHIWLKGIVNHCINPLTVIHHCKNGELLRIEEYRRQLATLCSEAMEAAAETEVELPTGDVIGKVVEVARLTADNCSSMLQDVDRGKRTEIDAITGHIIRVGKQRGLELPLSEYVYYEVKNLEHEGIAGEACEQ